MKATRWSELAGRLGTDSNRFRGAELRGVAEEPATTYTRTPSTDAISGQVTYARVCCVCCLVIMCIRLSFTQTHTLLLLLLLLLFITSWNIEIYLVKFKRHSTPLLLRRTC